jgi:hypothetical protein
MIAAAVYVVVIDDDGDRSGQAAPCRKPLDDLVERMRREIRHGRGSVRWRETSGAKVA